VTDGLTEVTFGITVVRIGLVVGLIITGLTVVVTAGF